MLLKLKGTPVIILMALIFCVPLWTQAQVQEGGGMYQPAGKSLSKAEKLYNSLSYHDAIPAYENYLKDHDDVKAMYQLGDCYRLTSGFAKAESWYAKAMSAGDVDPKYKLYYAEMLQANGKYSDAVKVYADYLKIVPEDKRAANQMKACANHDEFMLAKKRYDVKDLAFNCSGYDFAATWYNNGLIYASSKDSSHAISREHTWTGTQFFDMYFVEGEKTSFGKPKLIKGDASTKYHEANAAFTPDGQYVYFTRNNYYNGKVKTSGNKIIKLDIYRSEVDGLKWKNDQKFEYNNNEYSTGHPALTPDGNTMYFVSDMPGGYGATDIYVCKKDGDQWGTPQNLGPEVNTEGYEMFPYVDSDGELYFASDGLGGLGGLDIFRVKRNDQTNKWGKIQNLGAPINSSYDDFGFTYGKSKETGYFTSNRTGGHGLDDIYSFTDHGISLEGIVVDASTGKPICKSNVKMITKSEVPAEDKTVTACDGEFTFNVVRNLDYCFEASADGYIPNKSVCTTTKGVNPGEKITVKIPLQQIRTGSMYVLVCDKVTKEPIPMSKVIFSGECDGISQNRESDIKGMSCYTVKCECNYLAVANANGYLPGSENGSTKDKCDKMVNCGETGADTIIVELDKLPAPGSQYTNNMDTSRFFELKDIYYDFDKWNIRSESEPQLKILLGFLNENKDAIVEIASHTDSRAPADYNIRLSQKRAQSVVEWLVSHGIERSRLKPKGYGETKPRNGCINDVKCSEYEHQRNRRTEFRVISGTIDIKSLERIDMQVDPCKVCPF